MKQATYTSQVSDSGQPAATPRRPRARLAEVVNVESLSPHLQRITVAGEALHTLPAGEEGGYVKVILPDPGCDELELDLGRTPRPTMRSYTIQAFDPETTELVLDFVVNRHQGPATNWAKTAKLGDKVGIAGPGPKKLDIWDAPRYVLLGDLTSLNAVAAYSQRISPFASIDAVIMVPHEEDQVALEVSANTRLHWVMENQENVLVETVRGFRESLTTDTVVFMGLEARQIRPLRNLFQDEIGVPRQQMFAVGYWKRGVDADRFGMEKQANPL